MERSAGILFLNNGSVLMGHATETPQRGISKKAKNLFTLRSVSASKKPEFLLNRTNWKASEDWIIPVKKSFTYSCIKAIITPKPINVSVRQRS